MGKAIGIDLGTTNSVIAFKDTSLKIIRNIEGDELTRSCVGLHSGEFLVGKHAYKILKRHSNNTILSVKRLMGRAIKDDMVQKMIKSSYYKYEITNLVGGTDDAVAVLMGGKQYTPEQISAEILKKLKKDAELHLNDEVTHAVITVPAYFTEKQKNATRIAAQLADLKVQKLLSEPTAAAIGYGVENLPKGEAKTILIYDFGGGTFDLSIIDMVDGQFIESGTSGDRWLGGDDIDGLLQDLVYKKLAEQYKISDIKSLINNLPKEKKDPFEAEMRERVEDAKIQLSNVKSALVLIDTNLEDENGDWIQIDITITKDELEQSIKPLIERTINLIDNLLNEAGYDIDLIDEILLVGGTSSIPLVRQMLSERYGNDKIRIMDKPMLAVAEGAGILANEIGTSSELPDLPVEVKKIENISYSTNHSYYLQYMEDDHLQKKKIIEKQEPLPVSKSKIFRTTVPNQKIATVSIWSDTENGNYEKQGVGYFTIDQNLPIGSEIVIDINTSSQGEIFEVYVYPKIDKNKRKQVVIGRGQKDSHTLVFMTKKLEQILNGNYSDRQKDYFLQFVDSEIKKIDLIGVDNPDSPEWDNIGTNIYKSWEQTENLKEGYTDEEMFPIFATIISHEYPMLIEDYHLQSIQNLLQSLKETIIDEEKNQSIRQLKVIVDQYTYLLDLYMIKLAANRAGDSNPDDAEKLIQLHDRIFQELKNKHFDSTRALFNEAREIQDKYGFDEIGLKNIYLS